MPLNRNQVARVISRLPRKSMPAWVTPPVITNVALSVGDVLTFSPGVVIGYPSPVATTAIYVDNVPKGAGPYTIQAADAGKPVRVERIATNSRGSRTSVSANVTVGGAVGPDTWATLGLLGLNMPPLTDYDKSQPFVDLVATARGFRPYNDAWTEGAQVGLKANGQPTSDFSVILLDNGVAADVGTYLCGFSGQGTPEAYVGATVTNIQTAGGVTTFQINRAAFPPNGSDPRFVIRVSNVGENFGDSTPFYCLRVGIPRGTGQVWGADFEASLGAARCFRFMDWGKTNNSVESAWEGSLANGNKPWEFGARLTTMTSLCNRHNATGWFNLPALADANYRAQYIARLQATLNSNLKAIVEPSNEPWNNLFAAIGQRVAEAKTLTGGRGGGSGEIVSVTRVGSTVTAVLAAPHLKSPGQQVGIHGVTNISDGVFTLTSASGSTLVWTDSASGNATGVVQASDWSMIYLNPASILCAPTATMPIRDIWFAGRVLGVVKCRELLETIQATPGAAARMLPVMNVQLSYSALFEPMLQWTKDVYGDCDWCIWAPAYYSTPAEGTQPTLDTEQKVRDSLEAGRLTSRGYLLQIVNAAATCGATKLALYEMGPHNDTKTAATKDAVAAVHMSDWMRLHAKDLYRDVRNIAPGAVACWFHGGANDTFNTTVNNTWAFGVPHISQYASFPKFQAQAEMAAEAYEPVAVDGMTWGTITFKSWTSWIYSEALDAVSIEPATKLPNNELSQYVQVDTAGAKNIELYAGSNAAGDRVTILIDGVVVANNVLLPEGNQWAAPVGVAWSGTVALTKGRHKVTTRLQASRNGYLALRRYIFT